VAWTADPIALGKASAGGADATVIKASDVDALTDAVRSCLLLAGETTEGMVPRARENGENHKAVVTQL
jgi:hypothetical protein